MSRRDAATWVEGRFEKAGRNQRPAFHDGAKVLREIYRIEKLSMLPGTFPGRAGASDYRVYSACIVLARRRKSTTFGASVRQLAEITGLAKGTVSRALGRLRRAGWLALAANAHSREHIAAEYKLTVPILLDCVTKENSQACIRGGVQRDCSRWLRHQQVSRCMGEQRWPRQVLRASMAFVRRGRPHGRRDCQDMRRASASYPKAP
jgi:transposase